MVHVELSKPLKVQRMLDLDCHTLYVHVLQYSIVLYSAVGLIVYHSTYLYETYIRVPVDDST